MPRTKNEYVGQRSEAIAVMHLTRHSDVRVARQEDDYAFDLLVHLQKDGQDTGRMFGVEVKGRHTLPDGARVERRLTGRPDQIHIPLHREHDLSRLIDADFPFPLCLFYFTMDDDEGYVRWLLEPADESGSVPTLRRVTDDEFVELTDDVLSGVIDSVHTWYDRKRRR